MDIVSKTMLGSLVVQILIFIFSLYGFFIKIDQNHIILKDLLYMDAVVQLIETGMYLWLFFAISNFKTMTKRRYIDWFITTPILLITTIAYMYYNTHIENDSKEVLTLETFITKERKNIIYIVILNALMLIIGYLGEAEIINKYLSTFIGFILFFITFYIIKDYIKNNNKNKIIYTFVFSVWSLYGVAALFNPVNKNVSYNILDLFSKNFYGLFILYSIIKIYNIKNDQKT